MAKTRHSEESEKSIENYLVEQMKETGGLALKYYNPNSTGWPDRILLFPGGHCVWVELKSRGEKARALQAHRRSRLRELNFPCYILDNKAAVDEMLRRELKGAKRKFTYFKFGKTDEL